MHRATVTRGALASAVVIAGAGGLLAAAGPTATAVTNCTSPVYKRQFYANTTFSGTPKKTDCDSAIDQDWGSGAPASGLPADNFGVRWTVTRDFGSGGPFTLPVATQDGIRVYLDDIRKIDLWKNISATQSKTVNLTVPSGKHTLRVDFVNWTGRANVTFAYKPVTSASADRIKPLVPTGSAVAYDTATGRAKVSWSKNKEMDLAGYRVYRRPQGSTAWTLRTTTTATSYTDTSLPLTGDTYYYEVRARDKAGNESAGTTDRPVTTADRTAPGAPTGLAVTDSSEKGGLRTGWSAVAGAASYRVYRAATENGSYTKVGTTGALSYRDATAEPGVTYYYRVTALDAAGNESARSGSVSGRRRDDTPPSAVTGLTVTPAPYGFELHWDPDPTPDVARYVVYAGDLVRSDDGNVCWVHQVEWLFTDTTSYTYRTLPDGEERCFFVDAVDDDWNSHWEFTHEADIVSADELDTTPSVETPDDGPVHLTASAGEHGEGPATLSWDTVADATGYRVHRWNPDTGAYEQLATVPGYSFTDASAAKGTTHYYRVTALYADGTESAPGGDYAILAP
ncbi:PA14 domain-containing protein [Streptomyces aureus]|uniref:PA14 domain-containing protein n=1 Tax=Streptomyces aureus TaxID=193461 RepID=UPI00055FC4A8|nr:PA14 domain-containing protein [Streptomyces aureus]